MDLGISGKKVLITGASQGLGTAAAKAFADEGCQVALIARQEDKLKEVIAGLNGKGHAYYATDLMEDKEVDVALKILEKELGQFDIVINNVGGSFEARSALSSKKDWLECWNLNMGIAIQINNYLIPKMQKKKWGRIIHTSSVSGTHLRGHALYCWSKNSLTIYAKILGREVAKDGVVVTAVLPGSFAFKDSYWDKIFKNDSEKLKNFLNNIQSIGRLGTAEEVASWLVFAASEQASFSAGAVIPVDGGTM